LFEEEIRRLAEEEERRKQKEEGERRREEDKRKKRLEVAEKEYTRQKELEKARWEKKKAVELEKSGEETEKEPVLRLRTICYIEPVLAFGTEQDIIVNSRRLSPHRSQRSSCSVSVSKSASQEVLS
jgi:hypothetical protein